MKKIFITAALGVLVSIAAISQPTASITVENPRISGSQFFIDVYFISL